MSFVRPGIRLTPVQSCIHIIRLGFAMGEGKIGVVCFAATGATCTTVAQLSMFRFRFTWLPSFSCLGWLTSGFLGFHSFLCFMFRFIGTCLVVLLAFLVSLETQYDDCSKQVSTKLRLTISHCNMLAQDLMVLGELKARSS